MIREKRITTIRNVDFENETVKIDDVLYEHCTFTNCTLVYQGGNWQAIDVRHTNCKFAFVGAAQRVVQFLLSQGWVPPAPGPAVQPNGWMN